MIENKSHVNNHFIQKSLAKLFSNDNLIKWVKYKTDEKGTFDIQETYNKNQPISKRYFYSKKIETQMNDLENSGLQVIKKIIDQEKKNKKIILNRKETTTLRLFSLLSDIRTNKLRMNMENLNGDSLFNSIINNDERDSKEIQESGIKVLLEIHKSNELSNEKYFNFVDTIQSFINKKTSLNDLTSLYKHIDFELISVLKILEKMESGISIIKFENKKLFLTETMNFIEFNSSSEPKLDFFPICPNIGIVFYNNANRLFLTTKEKSLIFKNDVSIRGNKVEYKNEKLIFQKMNEFFKDNINLPIKEINIKFNYVEKPKLHSNEDKFIYQILYEPKETADICNAMSLIHNDKSILIYQNETDIKDAELIIKQKGIFRAEDNF